jgi:ribosomal protein S18 acetylase RimI-like enzyme
MKTLKYRKADLEDIPALARLRGNNESGGSSEDRMRRYYAGTHHPQQALLPRVILMAEEGGSPIGYIAGHLTRRFGCDGELQWIYVLPKYRGSQIASEFLRILAKWFVENKALRICVDVGNEHARNFYKHHGAVGLNQYWLVWNDLSVVL